MNEVRTCVTCAHQQLVPKWAYKTHQCAHPSAVHPVTGKPVRKCADMRAIGGACGTNAALFDLFSIDELRTGNRIRLAPETPKRPMTDMLRALIGADMDADASR